ncbi:MAG: hypothetical protein PHE67_08935 [Campylobacterales bacterium]|nr:hypothetical protein [Campylobacterales bacterium]
MQNTTLERLLKAKINNDKELEALIQQYMDETGKKAYTTTKELLDEILIYIHDKYGDIDKESIMKIFEAKISAIDILPSGVLIPVIYEKTLLKNGVKMNFGAQDTDAISSLNKRLLWVNDNYSTRTQKKLEEILTKAYSGAYTKDEFMQVLRDSFDEYARLEPVKLQSAADFLLRQGRNIGTAIAAKKMGIKYLRVVAVMDEKTTSICRIMNGKLIPVSDAMAQIGTLYAADNVKEATKAYNLKPNTQDLYIKGTLSDVRLPPYHFGCRTIVESVANVLVGDLKLDKFNREYQPLRSETISKIQHGKNHLAKTKYKSAEEMVDATMSSISKEGTHFENSRKRVIFGKNGCIAIKGVSGDIETCFVPDRSTRYYESWVTSTEYDAVLNILGRVKKWLTDIF